MNGDRLIVTHESYDSVLVGTGKQKGQESLSENRRVTAQTRLVWFGLVLLAFGLWLRSVPSCSWPGLGSAAGLGFRHDQFHLRFAQCK